MKTLILAATTAAVVVGGGVATASHYNQYQKQQTHKAQVVAQQAQASQQAVQAKVDKIQAAYDHERVECEKGAGAYDLLTPLTQKKTPHPVCGPAVVR